MCIPNMEFQLVNPTTQVALFSDCSGSCSSLVNVTWNVYLGANASLSTVQWTLFNRTQQYENIWLFGKQCSIDRLYVVYELGVNVGINTTNFTATNELFSNNPQIVYWRFEVVYGFVSEISSSALNFVINQPPRNGSCSISPLNGTTLTLFSISCLDWFDEDDIKDYSLYGITN